MYNAFVIKSTLYHLIRRRLKKTCGIEDMHDVLRDYGFEKVGEGCCRSVWSRDGIDFVVKVQGWGDGLDYDGIFTMPEYTGDHSSRLGLLLEIHDVSTNQRGEYFCFQEKVEVRNCNNYRLFDHDRIKKRREAIENTYVPEMLFADSSEEFDLHSGNWGFHPVRGLVAIDW
jgi:hypothetical protein